VVKMRGVSFRDGFHDFTIRKGGLDVFPRLVAAEHHGEFPEAELASGHAGLDALLCGGLPLGTSTLLLGPAETGKSTIATQFAVASARRGERATLYVFDENIGTFRTRSRKLGLGVDELMTSGLLSVQQVDPAELSPGEFAHAIRRAVENQHATVVVIDSLNGYLNAMPSERYLNLHLHELLAYLGQHGVTTLMTLTQHGIVTGAEQSPIDASYLSDTVILLRYFEALGSVRRAISVIKKRTGAHESSIREYRIDSRGLTIGAPLDAFQGVLRGVPVYVGEGKPLLEEPRL